jgi:hypothetical protein
MEVDEKITVQVHDRTNHELYKIIPCRFYEVMFTFPNENRAFDFYRTIQIHLGYEAEAIWQGKSVSIVPPKEPPHDL